MLFRRKRAPERHAEKDIYTANEDLPQAGRGVLPETDLLKSIHKYASRFYDAMAVRQGPDCLVGSRLADERSMDETALLAFGILLEEAGREALGKKGDLVFTEGMENQDSATGSLTHGTGLEADAAGTSGIGETFWRRKYSKRRKLDPDDEEVEPPSP